MFKIIASVFLISTSSIYSQSWGFNIGGFSFSSGNNNNYYQVPVVTYMPQNVYMRPYQYMLSPQPVIIQPSIIYYNNVRPRYNNRCYNNHW